MKRNICVTLFCVALLGSVPCMVHAGASDLTQTDAVIMAQVKSSLSSLPGQVAVDSTNGEVTPIGAVPDSRSMEQTVARARHVYGVVSVKSVLRIAPAE